MFVVSVVHEMNGLCIKHVNDQLDLLTRGKLDLVTKGDHFETITSTEFHNMTLKDCCAKEVLWMICQDDHFMKAYGYKYSV